MHLTFNVTWNAHIDKVIASSNRTLGQLLRNFKAAPTQLKRLSYVTHVRSKLQYAPAIWHPSQETLTNSIEFVRSHVARFISSDYSRFSAVGTIKFMIDLSLISLRRRPTRLSFLHIVFYTRTLNQALLHPPSYISFLLDHSCEIARPQCFSRDHSVAVPPEPSVNWNIQPNSIVTISGRNKFRHAVIAFLFLLSRL